MARRLVAGVTGVLLAGWLGIQVVMAGASAVEPLTETEKWVAQQVAAGAEADLLNAPGGPQVHGKFLSDLILNVVPEAAVTMRGVTLRNALVDGPVDFSFGDVTTDVALINCEFQARVDSVETRFQRGLSFSRSTFDKEAVLNSVRVAGHLGLDGVRFKEGFDLTTADIAGQLQVTGSEITGDSAAEFIRVGGAVYFRNTTSSGALDFYGATLGSDLEILGKESVLARSTGHRSAVAGFELSGARMSGALTIEDVNLDSLSAEGLWVSGPTVISNATFTKRLDLTNAKFSALAIGNAVSLPQDPRQALITGMTFQSLSGDWKPLRRLISTAQYDAVAYSQLEAELQRRGDFGAGDDVLWEHKDRERQSLWMAGDHWRWTISLISGYLSNYGRNPERSLAFGVLLILLGGLVFQNRFMAPISGADTATGGPAGGHPHYNPFEYSLGLFVPGLQLDVTNRWRPKPALVVMWKYVHEGLGWVITAIALAAFSGLLPKS